MGAWAAFINWTTLDKQPHSASWFNSLEHLNNTIGIELEEFSLSIDNSGNPEDTELLPIAMPPFRPNKGRFIDGVWHCNCDPRLPASHFQVKKESANKGRWFYCCTKPKEEQCGFFLWDEDAKKREEETLLSNTRTEPDATQQPETPHREKWIAGAHGTPMTPLSMQKASAYQTPGERRAVGEASPYKTPQTEVPYDYAYDSGGDEFNANNPDQQVERLTGIKRKRDSTTHDNAQKASKLNSPPSSNCRHDTVDAVKIEDADDPFATPSTVRRLDFGTPSIGKPLTDTSRLERALMPFSDPRPGERVDYLIPQIGDYPITQTILYQLNEPGVPYATKEKVQQILNAHCRHVAGIEKGRDVTRVQLKKKDEKIAELEQKIRELDQERELDKTVIRHFKKDMAESVAARRGKGGRSKG